MLANDSPLLNKAWMLTPERLTDIFGKEGWLKNGWIEKVTIGEQFPGFADLIARLHLSYSSTGFDHPPRTLICKAFGPEWYSSAAQAELHIYRHFVPKMANVPTPRLYGSFDDPIDKVIILLQEDLADQFTHLSHPINDEWLATLTDVLANLHAFWWEHESLNDEMLLIPQETVTRMPQALNVSGLRENEMQMYQAMTRFIDQHRENLSEEETSILQLLNARWREKFAARIENHRSITLLHGDFHLFGNIFAAKEAQDNRHAKIIDWSEAKRGIGPHDLMYMLLPLDTSNRHQRDLCLLQRYYTGLQKAGVEGYEWDQCLWDYRFSLLTSLFQPLFQDNIHWFKATMKVVRVWHSIELLE